MPQKISLVRLADHSSCTALVIPGRGVLFSLQKGARIETSDVLGATKTAREATGIYLTAYTLLRRLYLSSLAVNLTRSEERRVGKECSIRGGREHREERRSHNDAERQYTSGAAR